MEHSITIALNHYSYKPKLIFATTYYYRNGFFTYGLQFQASWGPENPHMDLIFGLKALQLVPILISQSTHVFLNAKPSRFSKKVMSHEHHSFFPYFGSKLWCLFFGSKVWCHLLNCSIDNYLLWNSSLLLILSIKEALFGPLPPFFWYEHSPKHIPSLLAIIRLRDDYYEPHYIVC